MGPIGIKTLLQWVSEAQSAHSEWRAQSWEDWEFRDGKHWTRQAYNRLIDKGINPLTINRIFPIMNLIHGSFLRNQNDIIAKGRTKDDNELAQVMSEALAYVRDQNTGSEIVNSTFLDEITSGVGFIQVGKNPDPRCEVVQWKHIPWYSAWWDPYASPWLNKEDCRYFFTAGWKNVDDVTMYFPEKKKEIDEKFKQLGESYYVPDVFDPGTAIEEYHRFLSSSHWANIERKRVRPVEMWYTHITRGTFAIMHDSRVIDIDTIKDPRDQFGIIRAADEVVNANVKKMRVATFLSDLLLQDVETPYIHDRYPFAPFVGYLDRFNCPFGIPRQIKEQSMEVNKRRSMALALINSRRIAIEADAVEDLNKAYSEANKPDGMLVLKKGRLNSYRIDEMSSLAAPQIDLMNQSEREIQEIAGANDEALSRDSRLQSGVALDKKQDISATVTASLLENVKYSQRRLGELTMSMVQSEWTAPKVLRVTDRMSGAEKFVELNSRMYNPQLGTIEIRNNIQEASFDIITASAPITDTMREKNMDLLFSAINKAPPEAVGPLLNLAFEISDLPSKDALLKQIRAATGLENDDESQPMAEREARAAQLKAQVEQAKAVESDLSQREREAAIAEIIAKVEKMHAEAAAKTRESEREDWKAGHELGQTILKAQTEEIVA